MTSSRGGGLVKMMVNDRRGIRLLFVTSLFWNC